MGMDWPEMGFATPFPAKFRLRTIIRKTYFGQKVGLHPLKIDINNTEKNRPDLPVPTVPLPSPYLLSRRGLWPKYILRKIVKIVNFRKIVKSNPMSLLKGQLQGVCYGKIRKHKKKYFLENRKIQPHSLFKGTTAGNSLETSPK